MDQENKGIYEFGDFQLDIGKGVLLREGQPVSMQWKTFELLCVLIKSNGNLIKRDKLMSDLWADTFVEENNLSQHIRLLRKALGEGENESKFIETVPRRGYRFVAEVKKVSTVEPALEVNSSQNGTHLRTLTLERADTDETKIVIDHTFSPENPNGNQQNNHQNSAKPKRRKLWQLPVIILGVVAVVAFGAWYYKSLTKEKSLAPFDSINISKITQTGNVDVHSISPDGKYVAYVKDEGGQRSLIVRQIITGSDIEVVPPTDFYIIALTFSNDGNYIYYVLADEKIGTLYRIPALGGIPKEIIVDIDSQISFSPDGNQFVFRRENPVTLIDEIIIAKSDGTDAQPFITTAEAGYKRFGDIIWSPNGDKLLITSTDNARLNHKLFTISIKDKKIEQLGDQIWFWISSFCWLKDDKGIVFNARKNEREQGQIWHLPFPFTEFKQITHESNGYRFISCSSEGNTISALRFNFMESLWSHNLQLKETTQITPDGTSRLGMNGITQIPDGKLLVTKNDINTGSNNFWTLSENGKDETQLTNETYFVSNPVLTPDGRYIVFTSYRNGDLRIWRIDTDGKNPVQLTDSPEGFDAFPEVLADSKTIIFARLLDTVNSKIMITTINGGEAREIFPETKTHENFPCVSKDKKLLAYWERTFNQEPLPIKSVLKIATIEGENFIPAKKEFNIETFTNASWKPCRFTEDNKNVVFVSQQDPRNLSVMPLDGSAPKQLTDFKAGEISNFDLSNDGKRLFIVRAIVDSDLVLIKDTGSPPN